MRSVTSSPPEAVVSAPDEGTTPDDAFGVYVHVPYCARACPYCDFDFVVGARPQVEPYLAGLRAEIEARALRGLTPHTVYIGGGTPSLLGADGLRRLLQTLGDAMALDDAVETTVELNPEHVDAALLQALVERGCTRVSMGTQTLNASGLVQLGRVHDAAAAVTAVAQAAEVGLSVSADLIVGWPGQTDAMLAADLAGLTQAGARHVSVYALTIEPDTPWPALVRRGKRAMPDDDAQADRLAQTAQWAEDAGWIHYEIASYATDPSSRSRHNLAYWTAHDYVGLGPSAASAHFDAQGAVVRRSNPRGLRAWCDGAEGSLERLSPTAAAAEGLWLGLRVLTGLSVPAFLDRFTAVDRDWVERRVARLVRRGDIEWASPDCVRIAPGRWLMHDAIAAELL